MKRFLLFGGDEETTGWGSFLHDFDIIDEARVAAAAFCAKAEWWAWWEIVDQETRAIAEQGDIVGSVEREQLERREKESAAFINGSKKHTLEPKASASLPFVGRSGASRMVGYEEHL